MANSIGVLHPAGHDPVEIADLAASLGYDRFYTGELWGSDSFVELALAAETPIDLGTAVVNVYSRSPATLAQAAATLAARTSGDVVLGLGTSTEQAIESIHGQSFDRPVRRLHETAELAGRILRSADPVEYEGETVGAGGVPGFDVDVPVYTAALGAAARRATGRVADGWIPHNIPFDRLDAAFETVAGAARERDRDPAAITVAPYVPAAIDEDPDRAEAALRGHIAYYVGSGEGYRRAVGEVFSKEADAIASAWQAGDRAAARAEVTEEMVRAMGIAGVPAEGREQFRALCERDVVDAPIVVVPRNATELAETTIEALAEVCE